MDTPCTDPDCLAPDDHPAFTSPLGDLIRNAAAMADESLYLAMIEQTGAPQPIRRPIITGGPFATTAQSAGRVGTKR